MKIKNIISALLLICVFCSTNAQDSTKSDRVKRFKLGISIGSPELISLHGEGLLPGLNNHLAVGARAGWFKLNTITSLLWGVNVNYYINNKGKGIYVGAEFERNSLYSNNPEMTGFSQSMIYSNTTNYKYYYRYYCFYGGYACVWNKLFFTPELGVGFSHEDNYVEEKVTINNKSMSITEPLNPQLKKNGMGLVLRLSFGYRF